MLVFAGDDEQVEEIERRGFDANDRLAGTGGRLWDVGKFEFVRRAEMRTQNGFHGDPSCGVPSVRTRNP